MKFKNKNEIKKNFYLFKKKKKNYIKFIFFKFFLIFNKDKTKT